jgi:hypothetical protein
MENMVIKNINIIDWDLKQKFENVKITEKSKKSDFYFEISLKSKVEGVDIPLVLEISKNELLNNTINWRYLASASEDEKITKVSEIKNLSKDIQDIFENKRFDKDYLNTFLECWDKSKEDETDETEEDLGDNYYDDDYEEVEKVKKNVSNIEESLLKNIETEILISENIMDKRKTKFTFNLNRELSYFERFNLETSLSEIETLIVSSDNIRIVI